MSENAGGDGVIHRLARRNPFKHHESTKERYIFPSHKEFTKRYDAFYKTLETPSPQAPATDIPPYNEETATLENAIRYGTANWLDMQGPYDRRNGKSPADYLYDIARFLRKPYSETGYYETVSIDPDWRIYHGRHRLLALKLLGEEALNGLPHLRNDIHFEVKNKKPEMITLG